MRTTPPHCVAADPRSDSPSGCPAEQSSTTCRTPNQLRLALFLALALITSACSREIPEAASKPPVTLDPDVFHADHPELFKTASAETRALPKVPFGRAVTGQRSETCFRHCHGVIMRTAPGCCC